MSTSPIGGSPSPAHGVPSTDADQQSSTAGAEEVKPTAAQEPATELRGLLPTRTKGASGAQNSQTQFASPAPSLEAQTTSTEERRPEDRPPLRGTPPRDLRSAFRRQPPPSTEEQTSGTDEARED